MSEHIQQCLLFDILRVNERKYPFLKWVYAVPNGGNRHIATAVKLKREGVKAGVADICVPIPKHGFNGFYIEMKFNKNKLTTEQSAFLEFVRINGYDTAVCYTADTAIVVIENYLEIKLSK